MGSRRVFPLSVDTSPSSSYANRSPPPPKSPVHRGPSGHGLVLEIARPPTGGSVGYLGFDRLMMMRQVHAAAAPPIERLISDEASAAVNHRQRMAAEQQRRMELASMTKEDYTGTPEGHERLQRQEERSRMREEELLVLRLVEAEKEAARKLQRQKELEEEKRVKAQYLAKIRAQREQQENEAKEKEAARKAEMERKMKALKEAADAKARAEFEAKQHAIEEEARIARENHQIDVENDQMQVEDVLGHAMQQEYFAERERQRQIAAEQEEWRLFQEREQEKQREATQLRRAAMAQQYEQDKQRRVQIHKLQKERAAQQAERKELQHRQEQERLAQKEETNSDDKVAAVIQGESTSSQDSDSPYTAQPTVSTDLKDEKSIPEDESNLEAGNICVANANKDTEIVCNGDVDHGQQSEESASLVDVAVSTQNEPVLRGEEEGKSVEKISTLEAQGTPPNSANGTELEVQGTGVLDIRGDASTADNVDEVTSKADDSTADESIPDKNVFENLDNSADQVKRVDEPTSETNPEPDADAGKNDDSRPVWNISAAREQGFVPFAQVVSVMDSSPAVQATLQSGDLLVDFGGIVSSTPKCLMAMAECVQKNVNQAIPVALLRPMEPAAAEGDFEEVHVLLCPRKWKGKGLLGCQLSPFKWPEEPDPTQETSSESEIPAASTEIGSSSDDGATALVVYDIAPASVADQAGLVNGDILAGCDGFKTIVNIATLAEVVAHIQTIRAAGGPVHLDINRWIEEDQCYRTLRIELSSVAEHTQLGFALTSFAEYYHYYSSATPVGSACEECYYTTLTTALHAAALAGHVACLEALLNSLQNGDGGGYSASDYLDWRDEDGRTPLFYACYAGQLECVRYLLNTTQSVTNAQKSFVSTGVDLYGDTVLHAATTSGNIAVIALLLENGCVKVDDRNHTRLTCAHVAPNVETMTFLGEQSGADLLATDSEERMPLAYACLRNDVDSIQYLCKKNPDFVDYADIRGNTPLHVAAWLGLQESAEVLINYLPSIALYITNEDGQNAAELARSSGMEAVATFLENAIAAADSNVA